MTFVNEEDIQKIENENNFTFANFEKLNELVRII